MANKTVTLTMAFKNNIGLFIIKELCNCKKGQIGWYVSFGDIVELLNFYSRLLWFSYSDGWLCYKSLLALEIIKHLRSLVHS